jgi:hypothetical protein
MDETFRLPLSGNVTQTINPWTWAFSGNSFALFNVSLGRSGDPAIEEAVLDKVGTYGRQIGQIADALIVVLDQLDLGALNADQAEAIDRLRKQVAQVDQIKRERRGAVPDRARLAGG